MYEVESGECVRRRVVSVEGESGECMRSDVCVRRVVSV